MTHELFLSFFFFFVTEQMVMVINLRLFWQWPGQNTSCSCKQSEERSTTTSCVHGYIFNLFFFFNVMSLKYAYVLYLIYQIMRNGATSAITQVSRTDRNLFWSSTTFETRANQTTAKAKLIRVVSRGSNEEAPNPCRVFNSAKFLPNL